MFIDKIGQGGRYKVREVGGKVRGSGNVCEINVVCCVGSVQIQIEI